MSPVAPLLHKNSSDELLMPLEAGVPTLGWDVVIIGGGPSGLSAALMLARACRKVLVIDAGKQRNLCSSHVHGLFSRDGIAPLELLSTARAQLLAYPSATFRMDVVTECHRASFGFELATATGTRLKCHALLLAQGVSDALPEIEGIQKLYGKKVHHCPFCDAWEHRGGSLIVYGHSDKAAEMAWELRGWTTKVSLVIDSREEPSRDCAERLRLAGVETVRSRPLKIQTGAADEHGLVCENGEIIPFDALFFCTEERRPMELVQSLGCTLEDGRPKVTQEMQTSVPGVFVAGNAAPGHDMVAMAVAQGATAAIGIQEYLLKLGRFYEAPLEAQPMSPDSVELPMGGQKMPVTAGGLAWLCKGATADAASSCSLVKVLGCSEHSTRVGNDTQETLEVSRNDLSPLFEFLVGGRMVPETEEEALDALEELLVVLRTTASSPQSRELHHAQSLLIEKVLRRNGRPLPTASGSNKHYNHDHRTPPSIPSP